MLIYQVGGIAYFYMLNKKAFTIIELVIVISVLIILIGIAIPRMKGMQQSGMIVKVKGELQIFQAAVESYYTNSSPQAYPGVAGSASLANDTTVCATYLVTATPQMITSPLYDPFNPTPSTEYNYYLSSNGQYYVISSMGTDAVWGCFISGTKVLLADGSMKTIESLKPGDVLSGSQQAYNKLVHLKIYPKQSRKIYAFNGGRYFVTDDHIFMTKNGWEAINPKIAQEKYPEFKVGQLKVGDEFVTHSGFTCLKKIDYKIFKDVVVYEPQLDGSHVYYADGFLVHNRPPLNSALIVSNTGVVSFPAGQKGNNICVTNGTGC